MSRSTVVVVNPASANGRTGKRWPELAVALRARLGEDFEALFTEAAGQGTALTRDALKAGAKHILSVGGDGTHNEVVNGFFADGKSLAPDAMLSVVPTGTGGDLRRSIGLPLEATEAIEHAGQRPVPVDIGRLTCLSPDGAEVDKYFINISSFGVSGLVVDAVNHTTKALGGKASFLIGTVRGTLRYKKKRVRITLDPGAANEQTLVLRLYNGVIANARFFGGGMKVAPGAMMNDGRFDVVVMGDLSLLTLMAKTGSVYRGEHLSVDGIDLYHAREVRAEPAEPGEEVLIDMDGEQPGRLPARWRLMPGALRLCVGPGAEAVEAADG
ncbi:MAG: diacylglycerol kinase family lipid kinase [Myxococcales bacterium]|nr:diacylglycerol kinase family lipid kinase [Myxococcales bacterium]